jgi:tetratricopeptide (TPR) repeat protein
LDRFSESFSESKKFLELDPISEGPIGHLAYHYLSARQYDEAIQEYKKDLQLYPDGSPDTNFQLGNAYHQKAMFHEAVGEYLEGFRRQAYAADKIAELSKAFAKSGIKGFWQKLIEQFKAVPETAQDKSTIASIYAALSEKDQTFEWLEKAYAEHSDGLLHLKSWGFDFLRSDPRYADLLRRVGLPQ